MNRIPHAYEVTSCGCKGEYLPHFVQPAVSGPAQHAHGLQPAEDFFDSFSFRLAGLVTGAVRGCRRSRCRHAAFRSAPHAALHSFRATSPRSLGCHILYLPRLLHAQCPECTQPSAEPHPVPRCHCTAPVRYPQPTRCGLQSWRCRSMPVSTLATTLARQSCVRIGLRLMCIVTPHFSVKVRRRVTRVVRRRRFRLIFSLKALPPRPCFDQASIHAELLFGKQSGSSGLIQNQRKERLRDIAFHQPVPILAEYGRPNTVYIRFEHWRKCFGATSAICRIGRNGCSAGTRSSGEI
jgi:hypothetical protein